MKRIISVILAAMMLLMIAPTAAHGKRAESRAPYGYVEHEYDQLLAFMEQTNSAGVKNGTQLSSAYDPNDPETWGGIFGTQHQRDSYMPNTSSSALMISPTEILSEP